MMANERQAAKAPYEPPILTSYGSIRELTRQDNGGEISFAIGLDGSPLIRPRGWNYGPALPETR